MAPPQLDPDTLHRVERTLAGTGLSLVSLGRKSDLVASDLAVLGSQFGFANVEPSLVVLVRRCGRDSITLPKFHSEINPFEAV